MHLSTLALFTRLEASLDDLRAAAGSVSVHVAVPIGELGVVGIVLHPEALFEEGVAIDLLVRGIVTVL